MTTFKKLKSTKIPIVFVAIGILVIAYFIFTGNSELPIYGPKDFNPELVDVSLQNVENHHTVTDFKLTNQNGEVITQSDYDDKVYVTDFFFTRCPSICPIMSNNMGKLQQVFLNDDDVMFLSMSVTPEMDSVPVLKKYADNKGAIDSKWNIATGDKKHIYNLARKSYFAVVDQGDGGLQDFIHTPNFILVDKTKQIRGVYNGTDNDEILRLIDDIKILSN
ncbi:SCO family protein [Flagellimonas aquimarina]|uniref:SCO family protein n=1 Tax=Flagellimonas aquimarina TaxID=2201895 RepID=A0A316KYM4_9FLAO|nr:SCO family protein [Allomuricauda koreensis]PWL38681.1 SCO family protein [Allomuricauda koreensis]